MVFREKKIEVAVPACDDSVHFSISFARITKNSGNSTRNWYFVNFCKKWASSAKNWSFPIILFFSGYSDHAGLIGILGLAIGGLVQKLVLGPNPLFIAGGS